MALDRHLERKLVNQIDFAGGTEHAGTASTAAQGQHHEFDEPAAVAISPLIGRDAELKLLEDRWEQALEGQSQTVLVLGEAGLGKSRLVRTIARLIREGSGEGTGTADKLADSGCRMALCRAFPGILNSTRFRVL